MIIIIHIIVIVGNVLVEVTVVTINWLEKKTFTHTHTQSLHQVSLTDVFFHAADSDCYSSCGTSSKRGCDGTQTFTHTHECIPHIHTNAQAGQKKKKKRR